MRSTHQGRRRLLSSLLSLALWAAAGVASAHEVSGKVVAVIDGDTVDVLSDARELLRIRVQGIDAPEKRQAYGAVSKRTLSYLVYGRQVVVLWAKRDRYKRLVGKLLVNGSDAGLSMIRRGVAWHYRKYDVELSAADRVLYAEAEMAAREGRIGLWADKAPTAPWDFRRR